jgi:hypothetical protein
MDRARLSLSLSLAGLATASAASLMIWLVLYEPVAVATAIDEGNLSSMMALIGRTLLSAARTLVRYL